MHSMKDNENFFSYESVLARFKRARSEDTLDAMYRGAVRKANDTLHGGELFQAQIAIERVWADKKDLKHDKIVINPASMHLLHSQH